MQIRPVCFSHHKRFCYRLTTEHIFGIIFPFQMTKITPFFLSPRYVLTKTYNVLRTPHRCPLTTQCIVCAIRHE